LFTLAPETKVLFGFDVNQMLSCKELHKNTQFVTHAVKVMKKIDSLLNMLGPDVDVLIEVLKQLGTKHRSKGVTSDMFVPFGTALLTTLECLLGPTEFDDNTKKAWETVFHSFFKEMQ
jgi:hemoglobin-like flavoprotein